ncbi:hypothetical protein [Singulisphaera sp. PoT]|uniref:hypothetical protein n=1 Tax=Singulisphaera sp. PoT TaxID=3411797 RepID=UPI003BF51F62
MNNEAVQEEIKLTTDQKKKLTTINETVNRRREEIFPKNQQRGNRGQGGVDQGGQNGPQFDREAFQANMEAMRALNEDHEAAIGKVLNQKQKVRVNQISLQQQGPLAVARPEIAEKLNMSEEQSEQIQAILQDAGNARRELMRNAFGNRGRGGNRGEDGGPNAGGPGGGGNGGNRGGRGRGPQAKNDDNAADAKAKTKPAVVDDEDAPAPTPAAQPKNQDGQNGGGRGRGPGGFDRDSPEAKAQFEKMRSEGEKLQDQTIAAVSKVLTKKQKLAFNKMLGEPFDLEKLRPGGGPGGRGPRPDAKDADTKSTTKATGKSSESTASSSTSKKKAAAKTRKTSGTS